jgi:hypothetical protein
MNVLAGGSAPKLLLIFMLFSALALTSSCSTPRTVAQPQFEATPPPPGEGNNEANYVTILGPVTGTGPRTFTISARTGIAIWFGCIGKGPVWVRSPVMAVTDPSCGDGHSMFGEQTQATHLRPGQKVTVRVVAPATTRWELRIDGTPQARS